MSEAEERVFPASRSRRQSLRRRGDVVAASWLQCALPVAVGLWMVECFGGHWVEQFRMVLDQELRSGIQVTWSSPQAGDMFARVSVAFARVAWPLAIVPWSIGIGVRMLQTRFLFTWEAVRPDSERLGIFAGFRRMGAAVTGGNLKRTLLQCLVAGGICSAVIWAMWADKTGRFSWTAGEEAVSGFLVIGFRPLRILGFCLLLVGLADLVWQGVAYERRIRMTSQEVREELRNSERNSNSPGAAGPRASEVQFAPSR